MQLPECLITFFFYHFLPCFLGHDFCYHADVSMAHTVTKQCGTAALSLTTRSNNMTSFHISDVTTLRHSNQQWIAVVFPPPFFLKNNATLTDKLSVSLLRRQFISLVDWLLNLLHSFWHPALNMSGRWVWKMKRRSSLLVTCHFTLHEVSGELCLILFLDTVTADVNSVTVTLSRTPRSPFG